MLPTLGWVLLAGLLLKMTTSPQKLICLYSDLKVGSVYALRPMEGLDLDKIFYLLVHMEEKKNWFGFSFLEMPSGKMRTLTVAKASKVFADAYKANMRAGMTHGEHMEALTRASQAAFVAITKFRELEVSSTPKSVLSPYRD